MKRFDDIEFADRIARTKRKMEEYDCTARLHETRDRAFEDVAKESLPT